MLPLIPRLKLIVIAAAVSATGLPARTSAVSTEVQIAGDDDLRARLAAYVAREGGRLGLPGLAVAVGTPDGVLFAAGVEAGRDSTIGPRTPFLIGSVTKTFTAAVLAELAARGRLALDEPVEEYLPGFSLDGPFVPRSITLRHLATHTSGLSQLSGHDPLAQEQGVFGHLAPRRPPGEGEYSSLNFIILGRVLEEVTGVPYGDLIEATLFTPLDMAGAFVDGPGRPRPARLAPGHQSVFGLDVERDEPVPPPFLVPAGFVGSSAEGLARYGGMLVGGGRFEGEQVLSSDAVMEILGPLDGSGRALSWGRSREDDILRLEHAGNARTHAARVRLLPESERAIVVLTNTNTGPFFDPTAAIVDGIESILSTGEAPSVFPWERLFKALVLLGTLFSVVDALRRVTRWWGSGRKLAFVAPRKDRLRLLFDVFLAVALVVALRQVFGVSVTALLQYFPDLGYALLVSILAGIVGGLARALTPAGAAS